MGLGVVVSAINYPLYLHFLGYELYGTWLLLSTILTFAQLGLLGIGPAITKLVAEEYEKNNKRAIQEYFMTALCMLTVIGVILLTASIVFKWQFITLLGLKGENAALVASLLTYMVLFSILVLAYLILNALLSGIGRIDLANYSQTALQALPLLVSIPLLLSGKGVISLLLANVFSYLFIFSLNFIRINKIISINVLDITSFSWQRLQKMISFGGTIFAGTILDMMVLPITKIIITRSIGVEGIPVFELAYRVGMQVRSIFVATFSALMPEISKLSSGGSQGNIAKMKIIISKSYRLLFIGATPLYILIFISAEFIFKIWLRKSYVTSIPDVFRILLIVSFVSLVGVIPYYINIGNGKVRRVLIYHLICAFSTIFSLSYIIFLSQNINIISIAWCFLPGALLGTIYLQFSQRHFLLPVSNI
ncbi:MAG: MATE family efflux transporter [Anaerolineaceae bacterium]